MLNVKEKGNVKWLIKDSKRKVGVDFERKPSENH